MGSCWMGSAHSASKRGYNSNIGLRRAMGTSGDRIVKHGSASNIYIDLPVQDRTVPVPALTGASTRSTAVPVVMIGKYRDS